MGSLYKLVTKTNLTAPYIIFPLVMPIILVLFFSTTLGSFGNTDVISAITQSVTTVAADGIKSIDWGLFATTLQDTSALQQIVSAAVENKSIFSQVSVNTIIITVLAMSTMQSGIMGFGFNFFGIKDSVLLKRAGATKLTKFDVLGAIALYGVTMWVISTTWTILLSWFFSVTGLFFVVNTFDASTCAQQAIGLGITHGVIDKSDAATLWPTITANFSSAWSGAISASTSSIVSETGNWTLKIDWSQMNILYMLVACITGLYVSYSLGLMFVSIAPNIAAFSAMTGLYFFAAALLGGLFVAGQNPEWMQVTAWFIPNSYNAEFFDIASGSAQIVSGWDLHFTTTNTEYIVSYAKLTMDIVMPIIFGTIALLISAKKLQFS